MGGVLFAFEEASSFWSLPLTWKCFFCAMTSTFTLNIWRALANGEVQAVNSPDLITFGQMESDPYELWEVSHDLQLQSPWIIPTAAVS